MSVFKKIWLGIASLVIGLVIFVAATYLAGSFISKELRSVESIYFPAADRSNACKTQFKQATDSFQMAVMEGDTDALDEGVLSAKLCLKGLEEIASWDNDAERTALLNKDIQKLKKYMKSAHKDYGDAVEAGDMEDWSADVSKRVSTLGPLSQEINEGIDKVKKRYTGLLRENLINIGDLSEKGSKAGLLLGIGLLLFSLVAVTIIVKKWVVSPLNKTVKMLGEIAEGEGDLTVRLEVTSNDELGQLAKNFNSFALSSRNLSW